MKKLWITIIITILLTSSAFAATHASSAGGDAPPPSGNPSGGGGGGGSPQFYDYYIPLVFGPSNKLGESEIIFWTISPTAIITTFAQNEFGSNVARQDQPAKIVFKPSENRGLTNGSLIRTTAPVQMTGQRVNEDIYSDHSFAYTILPRRMMGFEYYAPFDGSLSILSLNQQTEVRVTRAGGETSTYDLTIPAETVTVPVHRGDYINSSNPTVGAFYTTQDGVSASMAVPRYLHGANYYFDGNVAAPRDQEIDRSRVNIIPSQPTPLEVAYVNGTVASFNIFGPTEIKLDPNMRSIHADRGKLAVNLAIKFSYGGNSRASTVQLMSIDEMRAGEFFVTPDGYSTHFSIGKSLTEFNFTRYDYQNDQYIANSRTKETGFEKNVIEVVSRYDSQFIIASDYLFGYSTSPGLASHPMAPSVSFVNVPLNPSTQKNITGLKATWYRYANLAVTGFQIIPGSLEEYTGQLIHIEVKANGTLPASHFKLKISIDGEAVIEESYDFLQVNDTLEFNIRKFLPIGKKSLHVSVNVDTDNTVSEINEDDNTLDQTLPVQRNFRLRFSLILILIGIIVYSIYRLRKWLKQRQKVNRAHVDAILNFEEES